MIFIRSACILIPFKALTRRSYPSESLRIFIGKINLFCSKLLRIGIETKKVNTWRVSKRYYLYSFITVKSNPLILLEHNNLCYFWWWNTNLIKFFIFILRNYIIDRWNWYSVTFLKIYKSLLCKKIIIDS